MKRIDLALGLLLFWTIMLMALMRLDKPPEILESMGAYDLLHFVARDSIFISIILFLWVSVCMSIVLGYAIMLMRKLAMRIIKP